MWQAVSFVVWTSQEGHVCRSDPGCNSEAEVEGEAEEAASSCNAFELFQDCHFCSQTKVQPQGKADLLVPLLFKPAPCPQVWSCRASSHWSCLEQDRVFRMPRFCCLTLICPAFHGGGETSHPAMKKEQSCSGGSSAWVSSSGLQRAARVSEDCLERIQWRPAPGLKDSGRRETELGLVRVETGDVKYVKGCCRGAGNKLFFLSTGDVRRSCRLTFQ